MDPNAKYSQDGKQFGQAMGSIAHGQAMMAAIRDYQQEMLETGKNQGPVQQQIGIDELLSDPELEKLHADRIAQMKQEVEKRAELSRQGHGTYEEITEGDFLEITTKTEMVVCHFFHRDFERCKIMDKHLNVLCKKYFETRFIKLSAPDTPFFTVKLNIKMLPCVVSFRHGVTTGRVVGFDGLGGLDDFETGMLERALMSHGSIVAPERKDDESDEEEYRTSVRQGFQRTQSDEDSDFD